VVNDAVGLRLNGGHVPAARPREQMVIRSHTIPRLQASDHLV
jgi:hypothetical protein